MVPRVTGSPDLGRRGSFSVSVCQSLFLHYFQNEKVDFMLCEKVLQGGLLLLEVMFSGQFLEIILATILRGKIGHTSNGTMNDVVATRIKIKSHVIKSQMHFLSTILCSNPF